MNKPGQTLAALIVLASCAGLGACTGGIIDFGGGGGNNGKIIVKGNLDQILPVTTRNIVVFVFSGKDPKPGDCPASSTTTSTTTSTTEEAGLAAVTATTEEDGGEASGSSCQCPAAPVNPACTPGDAVVLASGQKTFSVGGAERGEIRVVFLLDKAGNDADGQIDPGDPIAILDDPDCELDNVNGNLTVTLTDVDVSFNAAPVTECDKNVPNPPAFGRARALSITSEKTPKEDN